MKKTLAEKSASVFFGVVFTTWWLAGTSTLVDRTLQRRTEAIGCRFGLSFEVVAGTAGMNAVVIAAAEKRIVFVGASKEIVPFSAYQGCLSGVGYQAVIAIASV